MGEWDSRGGNGTNPANSACRAARSGSSGTGRFTVCKVQTQLHPAIFIASSCSDGNRPSSPPWHGIASSATDTATSPMPHCIRTLATLAEAKLRQQNKTAIKRRILMQPV